MRCLMKSESDIEVRRLIGRPKADNDGRVLNYRSGSSTNDAQAAAVIEHGLGQWSEALLVMEEAVWGDGYDGTDTRWIEFYSWRRSRGEVRRLYDAPGHLFAAHDKSELQTALIFALRLGWDASLFASPGRVKVHFSHDDFVRLERVPNWRMLSRALSEIGFRSTETDKT